MSKNFSFHGLVLMVVLTITLAFTPAVFAQVNWKMTHKMPPESAEGKAFQRFSDLVKEKKSGGKMMVKIFPAEQLGEKQKRPWKCWKTGRFRSTRRGKRTYRNMWMS